MTDSQGPLPQKTKDEHPNWIYVGPTVARIGLKRSTLVLGNIPIPQLQSLIDLKPVIGSLFVPTSKASNAIKSIRTKGSLEWIAAQEVLKYAKEIKQKEERVNKDDKVRRF